MKKPLPELTDLRLQPFDESVKVIPDFVPWVDLPRVQCRRQIAVPTSTYYTARTTLFAHHSPPVSHAQ